jgi:hypothetical protein
MENIARGAAGSIAATTTVALIGTIVWGLFLQPDPKLPVIIIGSIFAIVTSLIVSVIAIAILGTPTFFVLRKLGINSAPAYAAWGIGFATLIVAALLYPYSFASLNEAQKSTDLLVVVSSFIAGPAATLTFWRIVRPDAHRQMSLEER